LFTSEIKCIKVYSHFILTDVELKQFLCTNYGKFQRRLLALQEAAEREGEGKMGAMPRQQRDGLLTPHGEVVVAAAAAESGPPQGALLWAKVAGFPNWPVMVITEADARAAGCQPPTGKVRNFPTPYLLSSKFVITVRIVSFQFLEIICFLLIFFGDILFLLLFKHFIGLAECVSAPYFMNLCEFLPRPGHHRCFGDYSTQRTPVFVQSRRKWLCLLYDWIQSAFVSNTSYHQKHIPFRCLVLLCSY
jgi:hypothetical protein